MKNELFKALYDCFYTPPELTVPKQEVEERHWALIEVLGQPERRLVLQIIDTKDRIAEDTSLDSFISGFELAWQLSAELNNYENERSVLCQTAEAPGARFICRRKKNKKVHHNNHNRQLSDPVCRCVAANCSGRGNTPASPDHRHSYPRIACHRD